MVDDCLVADGVVKFFKTEKGWGAITSDDLPAGRDAFVAFSVIEGPGLRDLDAGEVVEFDFEPGEQDSFRFVATRVRRLRPPSELPPPPDLYWPR